MGIDTGPSNSKNCALKNGSLKPLAWPSRHLMDEEQFEEIDTEVKLKLAELRECVQDDGRVSSSAKRKAQQCLEDVDQQV